MVVIEEKWSLNILDYDIEYTCNLGKKRSEKLILPFQRRRRIFKKVKDSLTFHFDPPLNNILINIQILDTTLNKNFKGWIISCIYFFSHHNMDTVQIICHRILQILAKIYVTSYNPHHESTVFDETLYNQSRLSIHLLAPVGFVFCTNSFQFTYVEY